MTMDRSLKKRGGLKGSRSVLTRAERIAKMKDEGRFEEDVTSPFNLPKLRVRTSKAGTKAKKEEAPAVAVEGAEGAAPAAGAAGAAPGAAASGAVKKPEKKAEKSGKKSERTDKRKT